MEALKKKRSVLYQGIQRMQDQIKPLLVKKDASIESVAKLELLLKKLQVDADKFYEATEDVLLKLKDDETDKPMNETCFAEQDNVIDFISTVGSKISTLQAALEKERSEDSIINGQSNSQNGSGIRYATIMKEVEPPTFDGDATKFAEWRAMFENLVHENPDYSAATKLFFLKKSFVGNAASVVSHYKISKEGYSNAWSYIISRYSKPKAVVGGFFKKLMGLDQIKNESGIQHLLDVTNSVIRGLSSTNEEVNDTMSRFIAYLTYLKLDENTRRDWDNNYTNMNEYPKFEEIDRFLQNRAHVASERVSVAKKEADKKWTKESSAKKSFVATNAARKNQNCEECNGNHALYTCEVFKKKDPIDRFKFVKSKSLCIMCLRSGHSSSDCQHKNFKCRCGEPHNYLLHFGPLPNKKPEKAPESASVENQDNSSTSKEIVQKSSYSCSVENVEKTVLLPSAVVKVVCGNIVGKMRVLLDSCSQATLISDAAVKKLKLPFRKSATPTSITGVGSSSTTTSSIVQLIVASKKDTFRLEVQADIVPAAAMKYSVNVEFPKNIIESLQNIPLADPAYLNSNVSVDKIDMIIGAEYFGKCILDESLTISSLDLRLSQFGWIVSGVVPQLNKSEKFVGFTQQTIDEQLTKFWEIEEAGVVTKQKSLEADQFVQHFKDTHSIGEDGKFIVRLPFNIDPKIIANNRNRALSALVRMERNLSEKDQLAYREFMREYRELGHMSLVRHDPMACFLPHRAVIRLCSSTTPLRVVFNGSAGDPSLNDALMNGPTIQRDVFDIFVSFRWYEFAFTADVAKMYRMIWLYFADRIFQTILWRDSPTEKIEECQLNTVTYGTGPAAAIAQQCLDVIADEVENEEVVAEEVKNENSVASEVEELNIAVDELENLNLIVAELIRENFYMDDFSGGAHTLEKAIAIQKRLHQALKKRGFILRKYASNSKEILDNIDPELHAVNSSKSMTDNLGSVAILGVEWQTASDFFTIKINIDQFSSGVVTKRIILSFISRTFDPLGLVSPVLIRGKLLLQSVWLEGRDWDDAVSTETAQLFESYIKGLLLLNTVKIPRHTFGALQCELVGFCDASDRAYCAAVYVRAKNKENKIVCRLIASKTRVAPLKQLTIPKLELQACKLLVDLMSRIANNLKISSNKMFAFSDSTVALCWLSKPPEQWKTFVSNRVQSVVSIIPFQQWAYVKSSENPADDATRGLEVGDFIQKSRWLEGPEFLYQDNYRTYHPIPNIATHEALERRKAKVALCAVVVVDFTLRFSSYLRLIRSVAFMLRVKSFVANIQKKNEISDGEKVLKTVADVSPLLDVEVEQSFKVVIRFVQSVSFGAEIDRLKNNRSVKRRSSLASLNPYLDEDGIVRVGGRLSKSSLADQSKHPVILSARCHLAKLYCRYIHLKFFHAKRKFVAAFVSTKFWFVGGTTNLTKFIIRSCVTCTRMKAVSAEQLMGQLPKQRITVAPPFTYVGVDFAGPFTCKCTEHRSTKFNQVYAAVFVCLTVRAVHIELVSGLSTEKFLLAFQAFVARRGLPSVVFSDNGTNFVGTKNLLKLDETKVQNFAAKENFSWRFIPPASPHHGGLWEAAVKSFKHHLYAVTRGNILNFEEFSTLFTKIEAVLNMRPLCYKSSIEQGTEIITPSHFLIGRSLMSIPAIDNEEISLSRRLLLVQNIFKGFWSVWSKDYLNQLQQRNKWQKTCPNLAVGQVVLVKNTSFKPFQWPLGLIKKVFPDEQGLVRIVEVEFEGHIRRRNITNLVLLPVDNAN